MLLCKKIEYYRNKCTLLVLTSVYLYKNFIKKDSGLTLKHPGLIPPTVAGPMMRTPLSWASLISFLVWFSGMPSAMMATVLIWGKLMASTALSYADLQFLKE